MTTQRKPKTKPGALMRMVRAREYEKLLGLLMYAMGEHTAVLTPETVEGFVLDHGTQGRIEVAAAEGDSVRFTIRDDMSA